MKKLLIPILLLLEIVSFGQKNYYTLNNDSIFNEKTFKAGFESTAKKLSPGLILIPIIYHKIIGKDSIINYVLFTPYMPKENESKYTQSKFEFVFKQDSLFLLLNKKLPEFSLKDLNGKTFNSSNLLGKPTLIAFWSIQCTPCVEEFPQLDKLKEKYGDKMNFIAIGENSKGEIQDLLKKKSFSYYILQEGYSYKTRILKMTSLPRNIFIDKNGYIRDIQGGLPYEKDPKTGKLFIRNTQQFEKIIRKKLFL